jgi:hypothetical protein
MIVIGEDDIRIEWSERAADSHFYKNWLKLNSYDVESSTIASRQQHWGSEYTDTLQSSSYQYVMAGDIVAAAMVNAFE